MRLSLPRSHQPRSNRAKQRFVLWFLAVRINRMTFHPHTVYKLPLLRVGYKISFEIGGVWPAMTMIWRLIGLKHAMQNRNIG